MTSKHFVNLFKVTVVTLFVLLQYCYGDHEKSGWSFYEVTPKPGECPPSDPEMHCFERNDICKSDCECSQKQKCCFQEDCGYSCKEPTVFIETMATCDKKIADSIKPGTCPPPLLTVLCAKCLDQCLSDCECEGQKKCCPQPGCGNWCRDTAEIMYG